MERFEWLIEPRVGIFQDPALGCFSEDSIALVHFFAGRKTDRVLDLGAGNGVLSLYGEALYGGDWTGVDVDRDQIALAERSAARNGQAIRFETMRAEDAPTAFGHGSFTKVLMNPPYFTSGDEGKRGTARHASGSLLSDWCGAAFLLLQNGGTLTFCYPADRLAAAFRALDENRFAPKRMQLLMSGACARLALIEAKKLGADGVRVTVAPTKPKGGIPTDRIGTLV